MLRRHTRLVLAGLTVVTTWAACGDGSTANTESRSPSTTIDVYAASSLTEAFTALGKSFEKAHPNGRVTFNFGGSGVLARQVVEGAPAEVLATADEETMNEVVAAGEASAPKVFARNRLALAVARSNPKGIRGLTDLARADVGFVMCAPSVPCGKLAAAALERAAVGARPRSLEENVKAVLTRVTLGEADAGIVYDTDVTAAGPVVDRIAVAESRDPALQAVYPIAAVADGRGAGTRGRMARAFVAYVRGPDGRRALARYGFLAP